GYFRLYPYAATRRGLRAINAAGRPFAVYLHPWEFDPGQPRLRPGLMRSFRHYVGLHRTDGRLVQLLKDFRLGTLSAALGEWWPQRGRRPLAAGRQQTGGTPCESPPRTPPPDNPRRALVGPCAWSSWMRNCPTRRLPASAFAR